MRLGETRNILWEVLTEDNKISLESEPIFGGQAQVVKNYGPVMSALAILSDLSWNTTEYAPIEAIRNEYDVQLQEIQLPQDKFDQFNAYISSLNATLPVYVSILETMVEDQDEKSINIKLPDSIKTLDDLTTFNKRVDKLFKSFQIDGHFEFREFDKGTSWYEILVIGVYTYPYFIACLKIAQEYYKAEAEYFKSKEAKISFETSKKQNENLSLESYKKEWLEMFIREEVKALVEEKIKETNGETEASLQNKLVIATTNLVKELGEGTEFHLSLNPPEYATEQAGHLVIDYKKIKSLRAEHKPKQITSEKEEEKKKDEN